jgi:uncharacterized protein YdeI (YjbR/CyaY-like superfamily)
MLKISIMKKATTELPLMLFESPADWEAWLKDNHAASSGVRLQIAKKDSGRQSPSYAEALDVALCYGWIDGQKLALDDKFYIQKFTPRRPKSIWSKINTEKVAVLIKQGRMQPAGLKEIEKAKADGRWDAAYSSQKNAEVPADFSAELDKNPEAKAFFATLNKVNVYAIYFRIQTAKKPETRRSRIEKFIAMLNKHEKIYP